MRSLKRRLPLLLLASPFYGLPTHAQTPVDPAFAALLQQKLDSCRTAFDVPGISATILLPGDRFWNGVSGVADIYTEEPMDTDFVFQAASTTKLFTATIVFQLIEEGLLDLDDTIGTYLPPMPNIPGSRRIRYLLNHRSGLTDYLQQPGAFDNWFATPDSVWPPQQVLEHYNAPPLFSQNAAFSYSNTNYMLLGMIVEAVTGHPFAQELQTRILYPLGLDEVYFPPALPVLGELVPGWTSWTTVGVFDTDVTPVLRDCYASFAYCAGGVVVRPWELAHFTRALMTGALLSPASLTTMRTCTNVSFSDGATGYGYGTMRYYYAGRNYFGHGGDINGFTQMTIHCTLDSVTFTMSINRNNAPRGPIAGVMLAAVHEGLEMGVPEAVVIAPELSVYPVPARERVTLRSNELSAGDRIDLLDANGRVMRSERCGQMRAYELSVSGLAPGVYGVSWLSRAVAVHRTIVVE